jgi:hypothetical protein
VQIIGAHFEEPVILPRFDIIFQLVLEKCWFEQAVDFTNIAVKKRLSFSGSYFEGYSPEETPFDQKTLSLVSAQIGEHLSLVLLLH